MGLVSRRAHAAAALVLAWAGLARAGDTRKVEVQTDPPGAKVYLNDVDSGAVCDATPCTIDAPVGQTPIIIKLDGYDPVIDVLDVPDKRAKAPIVARYTLHGELGTIVIDAPAAAGAEVTVDDEDKGKAPLRVQATAAAHHVVLQKNGQTLFDGSIPVTANQDSRVVPKPPEAHVTHDDPTPNPDGNGNTGSASGEVHATAPSPPRRRFIAVGGVVDVGFRHFEYVPATESILPPTEDEGGQVLAGPELELWPAEALHAQHLRGLSLFGRIEFGLNHQQVTNTMNQTVGASTFWGSIEALLRYRWTIADLVGIEVGAGYARDQMQFNSTDAMQLKMLPVADYSSIEIGGRISLALGAVEPYLSYENRLVLSGGDLATRFTSASPSGIRGAVGLAIQAGPLTARVEGSILQYNWSIRDETNGMITGAIDRVIEVTTMVGLKY